MLVNEKLETINNVEKRLVLIHIFMEIIPELNSK